MLARTDAAPAGSASTLSLSISGRCGSSANGVNTTTTLAAITNNRPATAAYAAPTADGPGKLATSLPDGSNSPTRPNWLATNSSPPDPKAIALLWPLPSGSRGAPTSTPVHDTKQASNSYLGR